LRSDRLVAVGGESSRDELKDSEVGRCVKSQFEKGMDTIHCYKNSTEAIEPNPVLAQLERRRRANRTQVLRQIPNKTESSTARVERVVTRSNDTRRVRRSLNSSRLRETCTSDKKKNET
jgi:hypothetical protein